MRKYFPLLHAGVWGEESRGFSQKKDIMISKLWNLFPDNGWAGKVNSWEVEMMWLYGGYAVLGHLLPIIRWNSYFQPRWNSYARVLVTIFLQ